MKKFLLVFVFIFGGYLPGLSGQIVKDPLLSYYHDIQSLAKPSDTIYVLEADFTGNKRKSIFITDDQSKLGPHGDYSWSVYCPHQSGGYLVAGSGLDAGIEGPDYIGYIDQLKRYGAITATEGGKYGIKAQYLENGAIQSQSIDQGRGHADERHYPAYFTAKSPDYRIMKYTLTDLKQKYASLDATNVVTPAGK
jgi:hypothetical protein